MTVNLENQKLVVVGEDDILVQNLTKIQELNNNTFFQHKLTNEIGRDLVYYLCNSMHYNLSNPEPVNLARNTLSKSLRILKIIDDNVKLPIDKYNFNVMNNFIRDFTSGKIQSKGVRKVNPKSISYYIGEFKRFWKIYRQHKLHNDKKNFDELFFDWGMNLKAPKINREYEDFPDLKINQVLELGENLLNEEYKVRTLLSINLMGRKCEIEALRYKDLDIREDGKILIKLPHVKKSSTEKTSVEVFTVFKKELNKYLLHNEFEDNDILFPTRAEAYAKNLRTVSEQLFKRRINPKTLRKIGLSVCDEIGFSRSDTERIGGWSANSPVISHYFNRKKPVLTQEKNKKIDEVLYSDVHLEVDKVKTENQKLKDEMTGIKEMLKGMMKQGDFKHLKPN